jgi:NADPH:quinone reductase-like Zn-dependent oxidoreductase
MTDFSAKEVGDESNPSSIDRGSDLLELRTLPNPVPQTGEMLVRVHTSGVNF